METYVDIIRDASIFMIIAQMLIHLVPSAEYEKYMHFLLDLICIMILFLPIISTIKNEEMTDYIDEISVQEMLLEDEIEVWGGKVEALLEEHFPVGEEEGE